MVTTSPVLKYLASDTTTEVIFPARVLVLSVEYGKSLHWFEPEMGTIGYPGEMIFAPSSFIWMKDVSMVAIRSAIGVPAKMYLGDE